MNIDPELWKIITSIGTGLLYVLLGSTGGLLTSYLSQRNFREQMKLEYARMEQTKPIAISGALEGAAKAVEGSANIVKENENWITRRFDEMQQKIDEQEKHLEFADKTIVELEKKLNDYEKTIEKIQAAQVSYRKVVHEALLKIMDELGNGHTPDLPKLKEIVEKLLNETETGV